MGSASKGLEKRNEASRALDQIFKQPAIANVVHYSCESFYDREDAASPRITSIAVRNIGSRQTKSFSIHQIGEEDHVNAREGWTGHLWRGRLASVVLDQSHLLAAMRYVERNPVRAGLAASAAESPWSSARAHLSGHDDTLAKVAPTREWVGDWAEYLVDREDEALVDATRRHERTGRVLGSEGFVETIEGVLARPL